VTLLRRLGVGLAAAGALVGAASCRVLDPPNQPVETCVQSCTARARRQCTDGECERGCQFVLDRLVEREGDKVVACVARQARRCADPVWAECAAMIGPHLDGGPPAPPPPDDEW
jgi:hypothetical protein